ALAQLYTRVGQKSQAQEYLTAAAQSAEPISMLSGAEVMFALLGFLGLCLYSVYRFVEWMQRRSIPAPFPATVPPIAYPPGPAFPPAPYQPGAYPPYVPPLPASHIPSPPVPVPAPNPPQQAMGFSYWPRGIAFIVYMAVFLVIALPFRLLHPWITQLS